MLYLQRFRCDVDKLWQLWGGATLVPEPANVVDLRVLNDGTRPVQTVPAGDHVPGVVWDFE
jgi:hypothetical protein